MSLCSVNIIIKTVNICSVHCGCTIGVLFLNGMVFGVV